MRNKFNLSLVLTLMLSFIALSVASSSAFAARPCRSDADEKATAEEFCGAKCKTGEIVDCKGKPGRWICKCKAGGSEDRESTLMESTLEEGLACTEYETKVYSITLQ